jgi:hypothetical protein
VLDFYRRCRAAMHEITEGLGEAGEPHGERAFTAPLDGLAGGRLIISRGADNIMLRGDNTLADLIRVRFERTTPEIRVAGGIITLRRKHPSVGDAGRGEIALNATIPWQIDIGGGAVEMTIDLRKVQLAALDIKGGASGLTVLLPRPSGTVPVRFSGGLHSVTIQRPGGVAARVQVKPGASNLTLDGEDLGTVSATGWETRGYKSAANRYAIAALGGANLLSVAAK